MLRPSWLRNRRMKNWPGRIASDRCDFMPNNDLMSVTVATPRSSGHASSIDCNWTTLSSGTETVIATVSIDHPTSIYMRVSHDVIFSRANNGDSPCFRAPNNRKLSDARDRDARRYRCPPNTGFSIWANNASSTKKVYAQNRSRSPFPTTSCDGDFGGTLSSAAVVT